MKNFQLDAVMAKIESKRSVYVSLIINTYSVPEEVADGVFSNEKEAFSERLKAYYNEQHAEIKRKGRGELPTMSELQGTNIFLEVMQMGLSFAPAAGLVYLSRLKGTGTAIGYQITGKGDIFLAQKSGAIDYITDPVIVRKSEVFKIVSNSDGTKHVVHEIDFEDSETFDFEKNYKCGYCFLVYPNGDKDLRWVDFDRMSKARDMSPNKSNYNDISFLQTKVIRRALRNVRKTPFLMTMQSEPDLDFKSDDDYEIEKETFDVQNSVDPKPESGKPESAPEQKPTSQEPKTEPKQEPKQLKETQTDPKTETNDFLSGINLDFSL